MVDFWSKCHPSYLSTIETPNIDWTWSITNGNLWAEQMVLNKLWKSFLLSKWRSWLSFAITKNITPIVIDFYFWKLSLMKIKLSWKINKREFRFISQWNMIFLISLIKWCNYLEWNKFFFLELFLRQKIFSFLLKFITITY